MSRMTREEFLGNVYTSAPSIAPRDAAAEIDRQVAQFLARGGHIQQIATGVSGEARLGGPRLPSNILPGHIARGARNSAAGTRASGEISSAAAAKLAGMSTRQFLSLVSAGEGPQHIWHRLAYRFRECDVLAWIEQRKGAQGVSR